MARFSHAQVDISRGWMKFKLVYRRDTFREANPLFPFFRKKGSYWEQVHRY